MQNLLKKINFDSFDEVFIDINEIHNNYKNYLENEKILVRESSTLKSEANFDSDTWIFYNTTTLVYSSLQFSKIKDLVNLNLIDKDDYIILKCWIADKVITSNQPTGVLGDIRYVLDLFTDTKGFKPELIKTPKGNAIMTFLDYSSSESVTRSKVIILKEYLNFIDRIGFIKEGYEQTLHILMQYKYAPRKDTIRKLPTSNHIFSFDYYIKDFFSSDSNQLLKKIYYPLLIWWKVTNIIPMRPSELVTKTKRDCLIQQNNKYYLKIDRIKVKRTDASIYKAQIPILNKIEISEEIYNLINDYINFTDFAESNTLFSWNAMNEFKAQFNNEKSNNNNQETFPIFISDCDKFDSLSFNVNTLDRLLDSFYTQILEKKYGYTCDNDNKLDIGDTRHLAFASLHLQGLSPIEIAMLGGHTTIEMQDSYINHVQYYIDNEVLNLISDKISITSNASMFNSLRKIVFTKPFSYQLDINLSNYEKTDDGIGYCLLNDINDFCDEVPHCIFCSKWWCEPSNDSYIALKQFLLDNKIHPLKKEIEAEEKFFMNLIKEAQIVNIDGLAEIDKDDCNNIKSHSLKIRAKADKLAFLKASLLETKFEQSKEILND